MTKRLVLVLGMMAATLTAACTKQSALRCDEDSPCQEPGHWCDLNRRVPDEPGICRPYRDGSIEGDADVPDGDMPDGEVLTQAMIAMTPTMQNFGSVVIGAQSSEVRFDVSNAGGMAAGTLTVALAGTDAAHFTISSDTCVGIPLGGAATCAVTLRFVPTTEGAKTAMLTVNGSPGGGISASLSGTGLRPGELRIAPASHDFGNVVSGGQSAEQTFTVTNMGSTATGVPSAALSDSSNFSVTMNNCTAALAASANCTIKARFNPESTGSKLSSLTVMASPGGAAPASLNGTGISPAALTLTPASQDLGSLVIGTMSAPFAFTVRNTGASPSGTITPTLASTDFAIASNGCTGTLAAGATCAISVQFTAAAPAGTKTAMLSVAATPGGTAMSTVTGTAITVGNLSISPATHPFGNVLTGAMSAEQTFTVINNGGSATTVPSTTLGDTTNFTLTMNNCTAVLNAGASCTVKARFNPTTVAAHNTTLQVAATTGGTAVTQLSGTGQAPATLSITPATRDFGPVTIGQSAGPLTFTISNVGNSSTGTITTVVGDTTHYMVSSTCTTLAPGANCTASVTYTASGTAGAQNSTITVSSTPGGSVQSSLTATAITVGQLAISPTNPPAFASVVEGGTGATQTFTITNNGGSASGIPSVGFATATNDFTITNNQCLAALSPAGTCTVTVRFNPTIAGNLNANLRVSATPGGIVSAMVSGVGLRKAALSITPSTQNFGTIATGTQSTFFTFTVTNTGEVTSSTVAATLTSSPSDFAIDSGTNNCTGTIAAGANCTLRVRFTAGTLGAKSNVLQATAGAGVSASSTLSGTSATPALLMIDFPSNDFGGVVVNTVSGPAPFRITNTGGSASGVLGGSLTGNQFTLTDSCSGLSLAPAGSCTMAVRFAPTSQGSKAGSISVTGSPGGTVSATLAGLGMSWGTAGPIETDNAGNVTFPQVGMDGSGNAIAVWYQSDGIRTNVWANRYVPSTGWGTAILIETNDGNAGGPQVTVNSMGNAVAVWQQDDGIRLNIWANRYLVGSGWGTATMIETNDTGYAGNPQVAMDGGENAIVVWDQWDGTRSNIWTNRYSAANGTWLGAALLETENAGSANYPQIAMSLSGNAIAVWQQGDGTRDNIVANTYTHVAGWGTPVPIETDNEPARDAQVGIDGSGEAVAVWRQSEGARANVLANRYVPGAGWGTATLLETDNVYSAFTPQVTMGSAGYFIAVWQQGDGTSTRIKSSRYFPGSGWGPAVLVDSAGSASNPQVAMDGNGNAFAVWQQFGTVDSICANRYQYSGSAGWGAAALIETDNTGQALYPQVAASPGNAVAVWQQGDGTRFNALANAFR
ncbi:MAG: choice-of-anchor D domain-containing protein [Deltaproteobacteria bacterium]|nr:choice-of-anchor D domain-containing protein [Deltaproteobacteria bacterium]